MTSSQSDGPDPQRGSWTGRVVSSMKWQAAGQAVGQAVTWLSTLVVIRLLTPEDYGLLAMSAVLTEFFILVADLGIGAATIQAKKLDDGDLGQLAGFAILTNVAGFLLAVPSAPLVAAYFREPAILEIVIVQAIAFLLMALYVFPRALLVRAMDFRRKARIDSASMIASALTAVTCASLGMGVWSLVAANLMMHATRAIGYRRAYPVAATPRLSGAGGRRFLQFGLVLTVERVLWFVFSQLDVAVGGRFLGKEVLGVYSVAMSIAVIPLDKLVPIINQVAFAAYSRIQDDGERVRNSVLRSVRLVSLGAFPIFLGLSAVAPDLVRTVLGAKWEVAILPLQLLSLVLPLKAVAAVLPPALHGTGQPAVNVKNLALSIVAIGLALIVAVPYGIVGLCLAWLSAYPVIFAVATTRTARALGIAPRQVFRELLMPAAVAVLMYAACLICGRALGDGAGPAARLLLQVGLGVAVYFGLTMLVNARPLREAVTLARS